VAAHLDLSNGVMRRDIPSGVEICAMLFSVTGAP